MATRCGNTLPFQSSLVLLGVCAISLLSVPHASLARAQERGGGGSPAARELATFGSGCFWCTEAIFLRVKGVEKVTSGYSGGWLENPTYQAVLSKQTGHAEVVQVEFDPDKISYEELLEIFWKTHDPTTPNRQGNDVGPQYRSIILYHDDRQKEIAEAYKRQLEESKAFRRPIVTEIVQFTRFYEAEPYHQNYYELNPRNPYCNSYIGPKIKKFNRMFSDKLKAREENR
jgi:peptide-methionine (S)-S-oxide reductase